MIIDTKCHALTSNIIGTVALNLRDFSIICIKNDAIGIGEKQATHKQTNELISCWLC